MKKFIIIISILLLKTIIVAQENFIPFHVKTDMFDNSNPNTLGLDFVEGVKTTTVFQPKDSTDKYSNGAVPIAFKGHLYVQWQSSSLDEDGEDTWVAYSRSKDGNDWTDPMTLAPQWETGIRTSGGWWTDGKILVAYINVWPQHLEPKGGYTEYIISLDGLNWSSPKPLLNHDDTAILGIFEQDPHRLSDGRILSAVHKQPGMIVSPYYTDDPAGIKGWTKGLMSNLPHQGFVSREIEPSIFCQANGNVVMIFRDQASSFRKLAAVSNDNGETWTTPVLTNMPDSRSKQCAGNLPDGTAFMISNPTTNKSRFPLVITLSKDGKYFDRAFLLRSGGEDLQPMRYNGRYKRAGYNYPKAVVWKNFLYVCYATNKEDVEITQVPLSRLVYKE